MRNIAALLLALPGIVIAQGGLGSITGSVTDATGSFIPGASVRLVQTSTHTVRTASTNETGVFHLPSVLPGDYVLTVTSGGFKQKKLNNIAVNGFQQLALGEIRMDLGEGPSTAVTVTAEQQIVKDTGVRFDTIQSKQVEDTPINGRNWATLLNVIPGSVQLNDSAINGREYGYYGYADFSINGKAANTSQVNLDGGSIVDHGSDAKVTVSPSLESIQEISVLTNNFTAEHGNRSGAVINVVTKSGANTFHGVAFEYLRNEAMNANAWSNSYIGQERPKYRYNYYGANIGGPIKRDKLFFFYNFENFKQFIPGSTVLSRVPTVLERQGDFSQTANANGSKPAIYQAGTQFSGTPLLMPGNIIPKSQINPLGAAIMNIFPLPNNSKDPNSNYTLQYQARYPRLSQVGKVDWNVDSKTRAYMRFSNDSGTNQDRAIWNSSGNFPFSMINQYRPDRALAVNATRTISPTMVLETLFGWSYDYVKVDPANPELVDPAKLGLSGLPTVFKSSNAILPAINNTGYPNFSFSRAPAYALANEWQMAATLTWTKGSHLFKFGGQHFRNRKDEINGSNDKGTYDFGTSRSAFDTGYGPSNTLVGAVNSYSQVQDVARKNSVFKDYQFFVQDTWRARRNLTFDYGLRIYHMGPEYDLDPASNRDAVFIPSLYDPRKAVRYYVPDPKNSALVIDPAFPNNPLSAALSSVLLYNIVPGSGDKLNGVIPLGVNGNDKSGLVPRKFLLFAPRGGFAWSPLGSQKTVVRGGFGWAYNRNTIGDAIGNFNNGFTNNANLVQTSLATMSASNSAQAQVIAPSSFAAREASSGKAPVVYDYSLSMQRELRLKMVVDIAYVGNLQRHQPINFNINAIAPGVDFDPKYVDPRNAGYNFYGPISSSNPGPALPGSNIMNALVMRPYLGFNTLTATANAGNNRYDALQFRLNKRFGHGLTLQVAYTHSRLLSGQENVGLYSYNWKDYTGQLSGGSRSNVTAINYTYNLPKFTKLVDGWLLAHMLNFVSGLPYSPGFSVIQANTGTSVSVNQVFLGTPDLAPRITVLGDASAMKADFAHQFDPTKFGVPAIYPAADGTGPRNFMTAPGTFTNNISLIKIFKVRERGKLELRLNAFNAFNQVRRTSLNTSVQYKAQGANFSDGFAVYNLPEQVVSRLSKSITDPVTIYNNYRGGVGAMNVTAVQPMRIMEAGLKFRF